ncbi:MAG TPA: tetratricopeptide repeat protein [Candidatus Hydrogenedentes bacterium]|nr:tetratricopeptide repeat protein [Candidatus Hydrogenedentota bacterium]HPG69524.1 tetratricopeptide repeat protein [Candidatus Hydrogenedentota bacterium]
MSTLYPILDSVSRRRARRRGWAMAGLALLAFPPLPSADTTANPVETLVRLGQSEDDVVEAVRRFHRLQQALFDWDADQVEALEQNGDSRLASLKREQAHQRLLSVRRAYEDALKRYAANARLTNDYGELLYDAFGEAEAAVRLWQSAKHLDPNFSAPYNNLAIHYCHEGAYRLGIDHYRRALELDPDHPDYLFNLAQTYLIHSPQVREILQWTNERTYAEAMRLSERAAAMAPDDFALVRDYAMNFFAAERFGVLPDWRKAAEAWAAARPLATTREDEFNAWLYEARAWIRYPDTQRAGACLEKALTLFPDSPIARALMDGIGVAPAR